MIDKIVSTAHLFVSCIDPGRSYTFFSTESHVALEKPSFRCREKAVFSRLANGLESLAKRMQHHGDSRASLLSKTRGDAFINTGTVLLAGLRMRGN